MSVRVWFKSKTSVIDRIRVAKNLLEVKYLIKEALTYEFISKKTLRKVVRVGKQRSKEWD